MNSTWRERAVQTESRLRSHPLFAGLKRRLNELSGDIVGRAELVAKVCGDDKKAGRALARLLGRDPKTIYRDLKVAKLPASAKERVRKGANITEILAEAQRPTDPGEQCDAANGQLPPTSPETATEAKSGPAALRPTPVPTEPDLEQLRLRALRSYSDQADFEAHWAEDQRNYRKALRNAGGAEVLRRRPRVK